jgi:hypothetical protein
LPAVETEEDDMGSLPIRVGIVDMTGEGDAAALASVAAALNVQVTRDLPQFWDVTATVEYLPNKAQIPQGVWPIQLVKSLPPGEGGFHMTKRNQPYSKVIFTPSNLEWTVDASHETLEMLVDPAGNRMQASQAIAISGNGVVDAPGQQYEYLVEVCDPCEADDFSYAIDGFAMSDFITPHYYDASLVAGVRYSFTGAIKRPRELLQGGYISFVDPASDDMQQILWVDPGPPQLNNLGPASGSSLREFVEQRTHKHTFDQRAARRKTNNVIEGRQREYRANRAKAATLRAKHYV